MPKIIVYSTPTCPYCHMAKDYLKKNNFEYEDVDVAADEKRAQEMIDKSGQMGVPVIDIDGKIIVGFDRKAIDASLGIKK
ncbi:MAG: glutaredoxin domain-containing protein [Candidatus Micrarchaeota archaeon]